jgi:PBP1b-binding outer membrane lipoprotein LpoB
MKKTIGFVLALMLLFSGCRKTPKPTPEPKPQEKPKIQIFVSPTAEQAYKLHDDC